MCSNSTPASERARPGRAKAAAFRADPDAALGGQPEPVLLDEWQEVPGVLGAVKRAVDSEGRPGRFVLTGSVRGDLQVESWPGTGRLVRVPMYGLTVREMLRRSSTLPFLDRLARGFSLEVPPDAPDLRGYVELALRGGFPEPALRFSGIVRDRWLESYVEQILTRDAVHVEGGRDPVRLRRWFGAYALATAGVVPDKCLYEAAGIDRKTALAYDRLLQRLFVTDSVPAWTTNRLKRLALSPKQYLVDPALLAGILRVDTNCVMRDGDCSGASWTPSSRPSCGPSSR